ncbi:hypothetical protein CFR78_04240 [Komagataeibacter rhaeticus]|uniref:hypothetical protein n=1 Tax=Komagataeibacter rhaeticus TaxID=215221 RepID=UPI0004D71D5A|nr:hypothetical protein [Komagataeibacter rhaeticus]KDU96460.1 hypothetical protein GLUCORHAEAF1_01710 [Komagataeibacter rhaeticus AF1]PYD54185.1 hypothetical protein CFR78_04240 [Komagataeibacter rhaeticus]GBQ15243.1 hypothetical protein AA16663_2032 [Komagataeibacter rhaeticus DSM 16663]
MTRKPEKPDAADLPGADAARALKSEEDARAAFGAGVYILGGDAERMVPPGHVIVVCRDPGLRRGGIVHPAVHVYPREELTRGQLRAMASEPALEVIGVG